MAGNKSNSNRKSSGGKSGTGKKVNTGKNKTTVQNNNGFQFKNEVIMLVVLAVSVILFLGNFGLAGGNDTGGNWLSNRMKGLFGITEYIFPIILFVSTCFCIIKKSKQVYIKTVVVYFMMLIVAAIVQLLRGKQFVEGKSFGQLFEQGMEYVMTGGMLGGMLAKGVYSIVGLLGAMVILVLLMMGCIIYLAEVSLVHGVETQSKKVYENTREDMRRRREVYDERSRQRSEERKRRSEEREVDRKEMRRRRQEECEIMQRKRLEEQRRSEEELEVKRIKDAKIEKQMAYMEQDRKEREARKNQYEKKEYVSANGMSIVTLEQPKQNKKIDESPNDIHEIFADGVDETIEIKSGDSIDESWKQGAFTIHRDGEISEVQITGNEASKINKPVHVEKTQGITKVEDEDTALETIGVTAASDSKDAAKSVSEARTDSMETDQVVQARPYMKPDISLLKKSSRAQRQSDEALTQIGLKLQQTLQSFGIRVTVTNISCGPTVTRFELQPEQGVRVSKIVGLADDIKLNLAVPDIRIEAPIPGKAAVGIEVPNATRNPVLLGDLIDSKEFKNSESLLSFAVGKDIGGNVVIHDVAKMPHLLVAGATGAGKSVCSNTLIMSILYKADPDKVKLIMIDPKVVELSIYNGIPHMLIPVVTDPKKAAGALNWAVSEMSERYNKMAVMGVRDVKSYNKKLEEIPDSDEKPPFLPQIVIIVDELADLMMVAKHEVEDAICRLAQLARAAGIHLIIATQRPSVDVITGLIKANMPSRIALSVSSGVDSRTIIDMNGAEKLLGMGDMLFYPSGYPKPVRVQGAFISDDEVHNVVEYLRSQGKSAEYNMEIEEKINQMQKVTVDAAASSSGDGSESMYDEYFAEAGKFVIEKDKGSIGMLQRMFRIGFNRAARIMDQLEEAGVVGAEEGTKPRKVLMSMEQFEQFIEEYV